MPLRWQSQERESESAKRVQPDHKMRNRRGTAGHEGSKREMYLQGTAPLGVEVKLASRDMLISNRL